jgi:hypothetical protein
MAERRVQRMIVAILVADVIGYKGCMCETTTLGSTDEMLKWIPREFSTNKEDAHL